MGNLNPASTANIHPSKCAPFAIILVFFYVMQVRRSKANGLNVIHVRPPPTTRPVSFLNNYRRSGFVKKRDLLAPKLSTWYHHSGVVTFLLLSNSPMFYFLKTEPNVELRQEIMHVSRLLPPKKKYWRLHARRPTGCQSFELRFRSRTQLVLYFLKKP